PAEGTLSGQARSEQPVGGGLIGLEAFAADGIYVRQPSGDFRLITIESRGGDVYIEAADGSIVDANPSEREDQRTIEELRALWADLKLTEETGASESIEATLTAYKLGKEQEYHRYWREYRNTVPQIDDEGNVTFIS